MSDILEFMFLRKSDLDIFEIKVSDSEWNEIIINMSWVNSYTMDCIFYIMNEFDSFEEFLIKLVETKGTFPDYNGESIQHKIMKNFYKL